MNSFIPSKTLAAAIVCGTGLLSVSACKKNDNLAKPEYRALTEAVYASGNIAPRKEYKVFAMADGYVTAKLVSEGTNVNAGDILFRIDNDEQAARTNAARDVFRTAQSNYSGTSPALAESEAMMRSATSKFRNDSLQFVRMKDLYESRAIAQAEFDKAQLAFTVSKNDVSAARDRYESSKRRLFVDLQNAESQYKVNAKQESNALVKSRINGMVYEVYKQDGEAVRRNDQLALLGDAKEVFVRLAVDELDIRKVQVGQEVLVKIDMYGDQPFKARVEKIYPMLTKQDQSFRVDAAFVDALPATFAGVTVEANIIVSQKEKALVIPKALLLKGDSVLVKTANGEQKVKIRKGAENFDVVEVLGGLDGNTELITKK
jgi:multidrug resistance efflux pump